MRPLLAVCLLFILLPDLSAAEEETLSVKAEVNKASLTVGERVEYRVTVTHDPSIQILSKIVPPPSDIFEVKEVHDIFEKEGNKIIEGRSFVLTLYDLGEFILEPVTVQYRTARGEEKSVQTNRLYLTVRSVDSSGAPKTDIRGVKGVLRLPPQWLWFWVTLLLLAGIGGGVFFWWRWKQSITEGESTYEAALSPEDEALIRLNRLFDSDLIRRGQLKEYFLELSGIHRRYFERRFEILAIESTTSEILRDLVGKELPQSLLSKIQQVMDSADFVKFAKWKPALPEITRLNQMSKAIVEEARPKMVPPESTAHVI